MNYLRDGTPKIAKLPYATSLTMVCCRYHKRVHGVYKPTNTTGGRHPCFFHKVHGMILGVLQPKASWICSGCFFPTPLVPSQNLTWRNWPFIAGLPIKMLDLSIVISSFSYGLLMIFPYFPLVFLWFSHSYVNVYQSGRKFRPAQIQASPCPAGSRPNHSGRPPVTFGKQKMVPPPGIWVSYLWLIYG